MIRTMPTSDLPFPMIDALGFFTVFRVEEHALDLATKMTEQNKVDGVDGTEFVVSVRKDGKFLVTAIEEADEVCWHIPHEMARETSEFPKPHSKDGEPPCGECRLQKGEICDICGACA